MEKQKRKSEALPENARAPDQEKGQPWYEIVREREIADLERQLKEWQDARPETVDQLEKRKKQISEINKRLRKIQNMPPDEYPQLVLKDPHDQVRAGIESAALYFFPDREEREEMLGINQSEQEENVARLLQKARPEVDELWGLIRRGISEGLLEINNPEERYRQEAHSAYNSKGWSFLIKDALNIDYCFTMGKERRDFRERVLQKLLLLHGKKVSCNQIRQEIKTR